MTKILKFDEFLLENYNIPKDNEMYLNLGGMLAFYEDYVKGDDELGEISPLAILSKKAYKVIEKYNLIDKLEKKELACVVNEPNSFVSRDKFFKLLKDNNKKIIVLNDLADIDEYEISLLKIIGSNRGKRELVPPTSAKNDNNYKEFKFEGCVIIVTDNIEDMIRDKHHVDAIKSCSIIIK